MFWGSASAPQLRWDQPKLLADVLVAVFAVVVVKPEFVMKSTGVRFGYVV